MKKNHFLTQLGKLSLAGVILLCIQGCHFNRDEYAIQYRKSNRSSERTTDTGHERSFGTYYDYRSYHIPVSQEYHYRMTGGSYGVHGDGEAHSPGAAGHHQ